MPPHPQLPTVVPPLQLRHWRVKITMLVLSGLYSNIIMTEGKHWLALGIYMGPKSDKMQ